MPDNHAVSGSQQDSKAKIRGNFKIKGGNYILYFCSQCFAVSKQAKQQQQHQIFPLYMVLPNVTLQLPYQDTFITFLTEEKD